MSSSSIINVMDTGPFHLLVDVIIVKKNNNISTHLKIEEIKHGYY